MKLWSMLVLLLAAASIAAAIGAAPAAITTRQGQVVGLSVLDEPGIQRVEVAWQGKTIPYSRVGNEWKTVLGVDLEIKPGGYPADVRVVKNGKTESSSLQIQVEAVEFPVERLEVAGEYVELSPENAARADREAKEIAAIHGAISGEVLWKEPFAAPIPGGTGSNFGKRRVFNGESRNPHNGADLKATTGTPILAANRGRIALAKDLFFTGNTVIVDHGLGIYTLYAHLSRIDVKKDAVVERSQTVGLAGATGRVTGPHLHWGARVQNARVDPFSLISLGK